MQAIVTKFLGPTNYRGSRIKARCDAGSVVISLDYAESVEENHRIAAMTLVKKLGWDGRWIGGSLSDGHCFVRAPEVTP